MRGEYLMQPGGVDHDDVIEALTSEFDDIALLSFEPAEQRRDNRVQWKHARSLRQTVVDAVFGQYEVESQSSD